MNASRSRFRILSDIQPSFIISYSFPLRPLRVLCGSAVRPLAGRSADEEAAVRDDALAIDVGAERRAEEDGDAGDVFRDANAPRGDHAHRAVAVAADAAL